MNILFTNRQSALSISSNQIERLVHSFLTWKGVSCNEVSVHFVNTDEICRLHDQFFNDPSPTDCISFPIDAPGDEGYTVLGEVFVCPQVGIEYAPDDPYTEVSLYIVHGLLHLLGFDDQKESDRTIMRDEENSAMEYLKKNKALLHEPI
ncbi:MAG: rRNA maturation RNase YbeY [Chlamydiia bacterium]|nr:rRNA maturation RNase YbeY [Chlamydiia bacterium]